MKICRGRVVVNSFLNRAALTIQYNAESRKVEVGFRISVLGFEVTASPDNGITYPDAEYPAKPFWGITGFTDQPFGEIDNNT